MRKISIIGSTGSIGRQSLDVVRNNTDKFKVTAISANENIELLHEQACEFMPELVAIYSETSALAFKEKIKNDSRFKGIEIMSGLEGLNAVAAHADSSMVITAVVGMIGLIPTIEAIKKERTLPSRTRKRWLQAERLSAGSLAALGLALSLSTASIRPYSSA
nr:hypothetical protein [Peptoclostridium acidaminophilum]